MSITSKISEIHGLLDEYGGMLQDLATNIEPFLLPSSPVPDNHEKCEARRDSVSPHEATLGGIVERIAILNQNLHSLRERSSADSHIVSSTLGVNRSYNQNTYCLEGQGRV